MEAARAVHLPLDQIAWRSIGDEIGTDEPENHLVATIAIGTSRMYVNAIEVYTDRDGMHEVADKACVGLFDIINQVNGDCDAFDSVIINGREYVMIATPFVRT